MSEPWKNFADADTLAKVILRLTVPSELARWNKLVDQHHYLSSRLVGRQLRYIAELNGEWVALLSVGEAAERLEDRDTYIGWNDVHRGRRLPLIGNNTRLVLLHEKASCPNLVSRVLGLLHRRVSADYEAQCGNPLVALETFVDPAYFKGTCYKASGWQALGRTKGFGRVRKEYYQHHGQPKELWFKVLHPAGFRSLSRRRLPVRYRGHEREYRPCPFECSTLMSLFDRFAGMPDPRHLKGRRYPLKTLMTLIALGTVCGQQGARSLASFAAKLTPAQRKALRCPVDRHTGERRVPGETCFRDILFAVAPESVEQALAEWMQGLDDGQLRCVAIDGKTVKGTARRDENGQKTGSLHLVMACTHEHARLVGQEAVDCKENEIVAVKKLLRRLPPLPGVVLTGDAMNTQREIAQIIAVEKGGSIAFA